MPSPTRRVTAPKTPAATRRRMPGEIPGRTPGRTWGFAAPRTLAAPRARSAVRPPAPAAAVASRAWRKVKAALPGAAALEPSVRTGSARPACRRARAVPACRAAQARVPPAIRYVTDVVTFRKAPRGSHPRRRCGRLAASNSPGVASRLAGTLATLRIEGAASIRESSRGRARLFLQGTSRPARAQRHVRAACKLL